MSEARAVISAATAFRLIAAGGLAFALAGVIAILGDNVRTAGPSAYSYSAVGHRAFVEMLRGLDVPVLVSRSDSLERAGRSSLLMVAEPRLGEDAEARLTSLLAAPHVLMVLPKWRERPDPLRPQWVDSVALRPIGDVESVLRTAVDDSSIRRLATPPTWTVNAFSMEPALAEPQLMASPTIKPLIASDQGVLLGQVLGVEQRLWVLSDPDLLSNHGIVQGDNAALMAALIERLRPRGGAVVVDETIHGFWQPPDLWRAMFELPFVVPVLSLGVAVLMLLWSAVGRFGGPVAAEPPLQPGKARLVENTAELLVYGGHGRELLRRYLRVTLRLAAATLHAPRHLPEADVIAWLDRRSRAQGVPRTGSDLLRRAEDVIAGAGVGSGDTLVLQTAGRLHRWKWELVHGPGRDQIGRRTPQAAGGQGRGRPGPGPRPAAGLPPDGRPPPP